MQWLVMLNRELGLHTVLIAHKKKVEGEKEPGQGDVKGASAIVQEAANVLMIWRSLKVDNGAILKVCKARRAGTFNKKIYLRKEGPFFEEDLIKNMEYTEV